MTDETAARAGFETARLVARRLAVGHEALLQAVFESAGDYFQRLTGRAEPEPDAARRELAACAANPGREIALLVDQESGEPVGAIGWWSGNPKPEIALLGMLFIVPQFRGRGLAREAIDGLEARLHGQGIRRLRTAVAAFAFAEHRLLRALGFTELPIREHTELGLAGSHLMLFEKPVAADEPA